MEDDSRERSSARRAVCERPSRYQRAAAPGAAEPWAISRCNRRRRPSAPRRRDALCDATEHHRILGGGDAAGRSGQRSRPDRRGRRSRNCNDRTAVQLAADDPAIYPIWKGLIIAHRVPGTQVYNARLVAAMLAHGIDRILTFNVADFSRYGVTVLHPAAVP